MPRPRICAVVISWALAAFPVAAQLSIVNTKPGAFIDISETGLELMLGDDDSAVVSTTIGNTVFPPGMIAISNNGGVGFNPGVGTLLGPINQPLPSGAAFAGTQAVLPFWDDPGSERSDDREGVFVEERPGLLIVQWERRFVGNSDTVSFQLQIPANTDSPIYAQFIYRDIEDPWPSGGGIATIGYQDGGAGFNTVQWSFNTPGAVSNGLVLTLIPAPGALPLLAVSTIVLVRRRR